jgi:hypothetical protein
MCGRRGFFINLGKAHPIRTYMKSIFTLSLILLCTFRSSGQALNSASQVSMQTTYGMVNIGTKSFYLEKRIPVLLPGESIDLVIINKSGIEIYRTSIYSGPYLGMSSLAVMDDGSLLVKCGTFMKKCDTGGPETTIAKVDTAGSIAWKIVLSKKVDCIVPFSGSSFYAASGGDIYHYDSGSKLISTTTNSFGTVWSGIRLGSNRILWNYGNGQARFRETDSALTMIKDVPANSKLTKLEILTGGDVIGLAAGKVEKYNSSYSLVANSSSVTPTFTVTDFATRNDSVFITGSDAAGKFCYAGLNASFQLIHQNISNVEKVVPTGITLNSENQVRIVGWRSTGASGYSHSSFFQTSLGEALDYTYDIGILRMNVTHHLYYSLGPLSSQVIADVTVKNFGNSAVSYFRLHSFAQVTGICNALLGLNQEFFTLIAPGDSVTVTTQMFNSLPIYSHMLQNSTASFEVCIHSSVPNNENDIVAENDKVCETVTFLPAALAENTPGVNTVLVFPNPSNEGFTITSPAIITNVQLIDISGRMVLEMENYSKSLYLPSVDIVHGLYFVKITQSGKIATLKVVVCK